jgi:CRISPR/Cas system-associated protein Cas5 (RAMP superfamily)
MAFKTFIYGTKAVVKESGGKPFLSRAVAWTDNPSAMPPAVRERTEAFKRAIPTCRAESKYKGGTVWGVSKFNRCLAEALK